jgi:hypothetical protein
MGVIPAFATPPPVLAVDADEAAQQAPVRSAA